MRSNTTQRLTSLASWAIAIGAVYYYREYRTNVKEKGINENGK